MEIKKVEFVKSAKSLKECPKPYYPEIAFIGRSNVGKSSLINYLCNNKKLAKVSETPGKTKTINHYLVNGNWYLVDLPGYGYAKTSKAEKEKFQELIEGYISQRKTLKCTMVLIDSRLEFQTSDKNFIRWLASQQLPFAVILTKIDKLSSSQLKKQMNYYEKEFTGMFEENPNIFPTSSTEKKGKEYLLEFFEYLLNDSKNESSFTEK
ncbi:MAG: YihA family ribosome biogenesis GTP-binding protein [Bacteroidetes bacterium]|nr:MAG: YihA family ribosome biogenesis GTP-binding protein [Bacteroidota bacterium]